MRALDKRPATNKKGIQRVDSLHYGVRKSARSAWWLNFGTCYQFMTTRSMM
jgi:hypothetical protein